MSNTVCLRGLSLGSGPPKIAIPLTGQSTAALLAQIQAATSADLLEWRADLYPFAETGEVLSTLAQLRNAAGDTPLLFTYRSVPEGGQGMLDNNGYEQLYREIILQDAADMVDVELTRGESLCRALSELAHEAGLPVILSSHDFAATPPQEEMLRRLRIMKEWGADLPKIAVTPQNEADVLALLAASEAFSHGENGGSLIAISMGVLGRVSRVAAGLFGSALTFGTAGDASAPGQLDAAELRRILSALYQA